MTKSMKIVNFLKRVGTDSQGATAGYGDCCVSLRNFQKGKYGLTITEEQIGEKNSKSK